MRKKFRAVKNREVAKLASDYKKALNILKKYDENELKIIARKKPVFVLKYGEAKQVVEDLKKNLQAPGLFGQEYRGKFESIVKNLYQTFAKKELYKSLEEKAAYLLYLTAKDHPFADGNKRIAAFLFVYFLHKNKFLYAKTGENKINNNTLASLTLLIAVSNPKEKEAMIGIITNLLN